MAELMKISNLCKIYPSSSGIRDVSMSILKGSIHGFLGLNGSGKTTTMKCVMGLLRKDGGKIEYEGRVFDPMNVADRSHIGFSSDLPFYPPYLTGFELMSVYGRIRGLSKEQSRTEALELLKLVGLGEAGKKLVGSYSRGMMAKLGIGVSLLGDPELLILDEPTSGMDPMASANIRRLLSELKKGGKSILFSSHQLGEVQALCENVTIIDRGKTILEGSVRHLSGKLGKDVSYIAEFKDLPPEMFTEIRRLDGVKECNVVDGKRNMIEITFSGEMEIREELARLAFKHKSVMLSCARVDASLEEVFLSLIG